MTMAPFAHPPSPPSASQFGYPATFDNRHNHHHKERMGPPIEGGFYQPPPSPANAGYEYGCGIPMRNHDGSIMLDHKARVVYKSQYLSTNPLRSDCKERVGYGGRKFTYVSGDGVIRTMNSVFGFGGWGSEITMERMVLCEQDKQGRWVIGYIATVRIRLKENNEGGFHGGNNAPLFHEDCGSGEAINANKIHAHEKALKSAITDAMKRAARHFGERLGNALYIKGNTVRNAPLDNKVALDQLEKREINMMYGDQNKLRDQFEEKRTAESTNKNDEETSNDSSSSSSSDKSDNSGNKNEINGGNMQGTSLPNAQASFSTGQQQVPAAASTPVSSVRCGAPLPQCSSGHGSRRTKALVTPQQKMSQLHPQRPAPEGRDAGYAGTKMANTTSGSNWVHGTNQGQQQQQEQQPRSMKGHTGRNIFPGSQSQPKQLSGHSGFVLSEEVATTTTVPMPMPCRDSMPPPSTRNGPDEGSNGCGRGDGGRDVAGNPSLLPSSASSLSGHHQRRPQSNRQEQPMLNYHQRANGITKQNNQYPRFEPLSFTTAVEDEGEDGEQINSKAFVEPSSPCSHNPPLDNTKNSIVSSSVLSSSPPPPNPLKRSTLGDPPESNSIGGPTGNKKQALARNPYSRSCA